MSKARQNRNAPVAHFVEKPTAIATIEAPGIETPIKPPSRLDGRKAELARFKFLAKQHTGQLLQSDDEMLSELAVAETELAESEVSDPKLAKHIIDLRKALSILPGQRFDQASRQRGAETYKMNGAARSPIAAAIQAASNGSDSQEASALG